MAFHQCDAFCAFLTFVHEPKKEQIVKKIKTSIDYRLKVTSWPVTL